MRGQQRSRGCMRAGAQVPTKLAVGIKQVPTKVAYGVQALADGDDKQAVVGDTFPKAE